MTSKKRPPSSLRRQFRSGSRLVIALLILLCFVSLLELHSQSKLHRQPISPSRSHKRTNYNHFDGSPNIAFLFLVRNNLPLDFLWHSFFKNADVPNFSIYIHSKPGIVFNQSTTRSAFFYNRQLRNSVKVAWGKPSMIEAERLLLEAALADPANQRFVLLSDRLTVSVFGEVSATFVTPDASNFQNFQISCVPLYNFSYVYNYLMSSPRSYVESFLDVKEIRYSPKMLPVITEKEWRKGSQWITLVRRHAEVVADDDIVFHVFKKFCKRRPLLDLSKGKVSLVTKLQTEHNCIPDEHYVQTLFMMRVLEDELERRTLTFALWSHSEEKMNTTAWHPVTFNYRNGKQQQIKEIKDINHVYYDSENRTAWCHINSIDAPCYLFARKFSRGAAMRLLTDGVVGPYDPIALFETSV